MSKNSKLYYTAGELADLFELPKQTLLYYDKMGVLSPEFISENNYRHYSLKQYLILEIIINMRKLGIPISKIKEYLAERSIDSLQTILQAKDRECEEIIAHNEKIRKNIHVVFQQLDKIRESRLDQITVTFRHSKRFLLSPVPPECSGNESIKILARHNLKVFSKEHFKEKAVGWLADKACFLAGEYSRPLAYFSSVNHDYHGKMECYTRPAGLYMTQRFRGTFREHVQELAELFKAYMQRNKLHAVDNLYIMPLKNHWTTPEPEDYIYQISLRVEPDEN